MKRFKLLANRLLIWSMGRLLPASLGVFFANSAVLGERGVFLPVLAAVFIPADGLVLTICGALCMVLGGLTPSCVSGIAAALICVLVKLLLGSENKRKYPLLAALGTGLTLLSCSFLTLILTDGAFDDYAASTVVCGFAAVCVFVFARVFRTVSLRDIENAGKSEIMALCAFSVCMLSAFDWGIFNIGWIALFALCAFGIYTLDRQYALMITSAAFAGMIFAGGQDIEIGISAMLGVAFMPERLKNKKWTLMAWIFAFTSVFSIAFCRDLLPQAAVSAFLAGVLFCIVPDGLFRLRFSDSRAEIGNSRQGGKSVFMSLQLERMANSALLSVGSDKPRVEDMVYAGVCMGCERQSNCFDGGDSPIQCTHRDAIMSVARDAERRIAIMDTEDREKGRSAGMFSAMARSFSEIAVEIAPSGLSEKAAKVLCDSGMNISEVCISQDGQAEVYFDSKGRVDEKKLVSVLGEFLKCKLYISDRTTDGDITRIDIIPKKRFAVEHGLFMISKEPDSQTGDSAMFFDHGADSFILISDGMGTGEKAHECSELLCKTMKELITAGFSAETSISICSQYLKCRFPEESFATLCMLKINAISGVMDLYKCGEGTSYIIGKERIEIARGGGYPLGIIDEANMVRKTMDSESIMGIVMLTDGGGSFDLLKFLESSMPMTDFDPSELSNYIAGRAFSAQNPLNNDDVTVVAVKLRKSDENFVNVHKK